MDNDEILEELCEQIRTGGNIVALEAVGELRQRGWLTGGSLYEVNLSEANLSGADLSEAYLGAVDLSGAVLRRVDLYRANLDSAILSRASLIGADLSMASLSEADLIGTDLSEAILRETYLDRVDLTEATFGSTMIADVDLSEVLGLESANHLGPSHISTETFYNSKGNIPNAFLKGCGVPDEFINFNMPLFGKVIEFYSCFISYSHAQKEFAMRLHDRLQGAGIRCWLDEHQVKPGQDIYAEVNRGIRLWDKVLLCCSKEALTSWWVDNEIGVALEKEQQLMKERSEKIHSIIPLNLDGYLFSGEWQSGYEAQIRRRLAADFTNWKDHDAFEVEFQKVLEALRTDEGREEPPVPRL